MENIFVFNQTVIGSMHISRNIPCEDSSLSFSSEDKKYKIAIVADGHGSSACFRSAHGSKTAVEVTSECFTEFAESVLESESKEQLFYENFLTNKRYQSDCIKRITDTIVSQWHERVIEHYKNNPVVPEEIKEDKPVSDYEKNVPHIYGTTLIAALMLPKCLILIQQGDGRCNVFYADGTVDQPIPWDSRCEFNTTTSMCDRDVSTSIRHCVIDFDKKKVAACLMGSDGVEDAYGDTWEGLRSSHSLMGGVYTFNKYLLCQIEEVGEEQFKKDLEEILPDFSEKGMFSNCGSGDDVSIAGIVDVKAVELLVGGFKHDIEVYELEDKLFYTEGLLKSKERKHGILQKRVNEAQSEVDSINTQIHELNKEISDLQNSKKSLQEKLTYEQGRLQGIKEGAKQINEGTVPANIKEGIDWFLSMVGLTADESRSKVNDNISRTENVCRQIENELFDNEKDTEECQKKIAELNEQLKLAETKKDEAQAKFDEYDAKYQEIQSQIDSIKAEVAKLC